MMMIITHVECAEYFTISNIMHILILKIVFFKLLTCTEHRSILMKFAATIKNDRMRSIFILLKLFPLTLVFYIHALV